MNTPDISTIVGNLPLNTCIYNAAGCLCTTKKEIIELSKSEAGAVVSKSSTLRPRMGNKHPKYYANKLGSINSNGLENIGYKTYVKISNSGWIMKPFFLSIAPFSINELTNMLIFANLTTTTHLHVEVNLSCPNLANKTVTAYDYRTFEKYLDKIEEIDTTNLTIGLKLPPYYQENEFDSVAEIIMYHPKIRFVVCINSIPNALIVDAIDETTRIYPKKGFGGVGGSYCKAVSLANVHQFYKRFDDKVSIVGCGGVKNGIDVFEHILCGASAVQVGTQLVEETPKVSERLNKELRDFMGFKKYKTIEEFRGKLKVLEPENHM